MNLDALVDHCATAEGRRVNSRGRHILYKCPSDKWTIGYGRNVEDNGIDEGEALELLRTDCVNALREAATLVPNWVELNDVRQNVLAEMCFNMGRPKLARFKKMLAAIGGLRYEQAAFEMMHSDWYPQVGKRAIRLKEAMLTGRE